MAVEGTENQETVLEGDREKLDLTPEVVPGEAPEGEKPAGEVPEVPEGEKPEDKPAPAEGALDCTGFKFAGADVTVEIPADLQAELTAKGVDAHAVVKELYTSDDFTLTEATKATLDAAFGKSTVDIFLGALKSQNELTMSTAAGSEAAIAQAEADAWTETAAQVGGEAGWTALEAWVLKTMPQAELDQFNEAMASGNRYVQKLAVDAVFSQYKKAEGDGFPVLITGDTPAANADGAPLSYGDFQKLIRSGEYRKNPKVYDALRRAGQAQGI